MIIQYGDKKVFDKMQYIHNKMFNKLGIGRTYLSMRKVIYDKPIANILLNSENEPFSSKIRNETKGCPLSLLLVYSYSGSPSQNKSGKKKI